MCRVMSGTYISIFKSVEFPHFWSNEEGVLCVTWRSKNSKAKRENWPYQFHLKDKWTLITNSCSRLTKATTFSNEHATFCGNIYHTNADLPHLPPTSLLLLVNGKNEFPTNFPCVSWKKNINFPHHCSHFSLYPCRGNQVSFFASRTKHERQERGKWRKVDHLPHVNFPLPPE